MQITPLILHYIFQVLNNTDKDVTCEVVRRFFIVVLTLAIMCGKAEAQSTVEVVGNLGAGTTANPTTALAYNRTFAQQFTTGLLNPGDLDQDGNVLHSFSWQLNAALGPFDPGFGDEGGQPEVETVYEWNLLSDTGGTPGSSLTAPGNFSVFSSGVRTFQYAALSSANGYVLESNTSYWLTLKFLFVGGGSTLGSYADLPVTTSTATTGAGSLGSLMENTGSGWTGLSERAVLQVEVESVPEPSTWALLACGGLVAGAALRRKWRRSKSSAPTLS